MMDRDGAKGNPGCMQESGGTEAGKEFAFTWAGLQMPLAVGVAGDL